MVSPAQQARGLARRRARVQARVEWFGEKVRNNIRIGMGTRIRLAAQLLRDKTVVNISRPVTKIRGGGKRRGAGGRFVKGRKTRVDPASRSKPGEFPKADTTRLLKDIFFDVNTKTLRAIVGTTLDYGLWLETRMNRSFLRRTLREMHPKLTRILTQGRGGGRQLVLPGQETGQER